MADVKETIEENKKEEPMDVPDSSSSCSTSKDLSKTLPEEAFNNFLHGKRHMLVQDYSYAVQSLATACEMYVSHYGEMAIECGEVWFLYGKALLRLSQQQAGVLGGAINDGSNEDDNSSESEGKENEETEENESEKNSDGEENEDGENEDGEKEDGEKEDGEKEDEEKEEKEPSESTDSPPAALDEGSSEAKAKDASKSSDDPGPSQPTEPADSSSSVDGKTAEESKTEEKSEENQESEEDDLELAWNSLETAKGIFKRQNTVEAELKVAEILQLLAEISMESDNNLGAINDLQESLKIQKKHLKPDDRILAETYYQMGLAQMLEKKYPDALENFRTTKKILELRRENLKNTKVDDADGTFKSADIQLEIADLDTILLDIQEKIDDTLELITNKEKETKESLDEAGIFHECLNSNPSHLSSDYPIYPPLEIQTNKRRAYKISYEIQSSSILMKDSPEKSTVNKPVSNITHLLKRKKPEEAVTEDGAKRIKTTSVPNGKSKNTETKMTEG